VVRLAPNHLRGSIAGRPTRRGKRLTLFVAVAQPKVYQFNLTLVVEEEVLGLQISVNDAQFMQVLNTTDDLLEELARLHLLKFLFLYNVVEQFTTTGILGDKEKLFGGFDDLEELDDVGVADTLQNIDFAGDSLHISLLHNLLLLQYFDSHLQIVD